MPKLSELPGDAEKRDAILARSGERARPEQRRTLTPKQRKAETAAALVAALIGESFSTTKTVTLGVASDVDENQLFQKPVRKAKREVAPAAAPSATRDETRNIELVPWVKLDGSSVRTETPTETPPTE